MKLITTTATLTITVTSTADEDDVQEVLDNWADYASSVKDAVTDNLEGLGHTVALITLGDDTEYHEAGGAAEALAELEAEYV